MIHQLIGEKPAGVVVCDRYAGYAHLEPTRRQVCWARLLRDFAGIAERQGAAGRVGRRRLGFGYVLFRWRDRKLASEGFEPLLRRVRRAVQAGAA